MERPRYDRQFLRLIGQRLYQTRMAMPETDRRVGAHHIDVAFTFYVPQMNALAPLQHDGQRAVIARVEAAFVVDVRFHDATIPRQR